MSQSPLGPDAMLWQGVHYKILLSAAETGGALAIVESVSPPQSGPPRHVHQDADETLLVLSGDVAVWIDGQRLACGPGQSAFVPRGREHCFWVVSKLPARMLTILTPGGFEGFFAEMAAARLRIPQDMAAITAVAARYQLTFTGPPLEAEIGS